MKMEKAQSFMVAMATLLLLIDQVLSCGCRKNEHPQKLVCQTDFVVRGEIIKKERIRTVNQIFSPYEVMYMVKVKKIFKGEKYMPEEKFVKIYTPESVSMCGEPNLKEGMKYLLSASYDSTSEQLRTSYCRWNIEWSQITQAQRQGLKHFYNRYCQKCEISEGMYNRPGGNTVMMNPSLGNTMMNPSNGNTMMRNPSLGNTMMMNPSLVNAEMPNMHYAAGLGNALQPAKSTRCMFDEANSKCERFYASCIIKPNGSCGWTSNSSYKRCKEEYSTR